MSGSVILPGSRKRRKQGIRGDGATDFASAGEWFTYLNDNKISYAVWSLSDKDETSAFFRVGYDPTKPITDGDLTVSGKWVRELIRGGDPKTIPVPSATVEKSTLAKIRSWISLSLSDSAATRQYRRGI